MNDISMRESSTAAPVASAPGILLAVVLPLLVLHGVPPFFRVEPGARVAEPFGWPELAALHVMATLPLSFLVGRALAPAIANWVRARGLQPLLTVATWAAWLAVVVALRFQSPPVSLEGEFVARSVDRFFRTFWLQLPWTLAAGVLWRLNAPCGEMPRATWISCAWLVLAVWGAVGVPAEYARRLELRAILAVDFYLDQNRLGQAWRNAAALDGVGSGWSPQADLYPAVFRSGLRRRFGECAQQIEKPLPAEATASERLQYVRNLAALDMFAQARELAQPLAGDGGAGDAFLVKLALRESHRLPPRATPPGLAFGRGASR